MSIILIEENFFTQWEVKNAAGYNTEPVMQSAADGAPLMLLSNVVFLLEKVNWEELKKAQER